MKIAKACRQAPTGGMRRGIGDSLFREALEAVTKPIGIERHCFQNATRPTKSDARVSLSGYFAIGASFLFAGLLSGCGHRLALDE